MAPFIQSRALLLQNAKKRFIDVPDDFAIRTTRMNEPLDVVELGFVTAKRGEILEQKMKTNLRDRSLISRRDWCQHFAVDFYAILQWRHVAIFSGWSECVSQCL